MVVNAQVSNRLPFTVEIFYMTEEEQMKPCGFVEPRNVINLPNTVASTPPFLIFFRPRLAGSVQYVQSVISLLGSSLRGGYVELQF